MRESSISIIMPIFKGESTVIKTLESLFNQEKKFDKLIIIDDASPDSSTSLIKNFLDEKKAEYFILRHEKNQGLASSYNDGIKIANSDLIVILHQDVILKKQALEKLTEVFDDEKVVASSHTVVHPIETWKKYNFWQKCFFARLAGKKFHGIDGKFDCFKRDALLRVGLFDEINFRSAGEDADLVHRLKKIGKIADTRAEIIHLHKIDSHFSFTDIIFKQKQYSEAQGALFARGKIRNVFVLIRTFFREILIILFFIPQVDFISAVLIIFYSFLYTRIIFIKEYKNPRILILPFLNIFLLFVSFAYSTKGFFQAKQKI